MPCVLTKRNLSLFFNLILPICPPPPHPPRWGHRQERGASQVLSLQRMRVYLTLCSHFNPNSGFNPGIIHAAGAPEFDKSIENPRRCDRDKDGERSWNIKGVRRRGSSEEDGEGEERPHWILFNPVNKSVPLKSKLLPSIA